MDNSLAKLLLPPINKCLRSNSILFLIIAFLTFSVTAIESGEVSEKFPVDVSFLTADLKYSEKQGVKICELQQGILSVYNSYDIFHKEPGLFSKIWCEFLLSYQKQIWIIERSIADKTLRKHLVKTYGIPWKSMKELLQDPFFQKQSLMPIHNPYDIHDYHGFLYARPHHIGSLQKFRQNHPGIIVLDAATFPYWRDKQKMSTLFLADELRRFKPKWNAYPKKYSAELAEKIIKEIDSDIVVIKPLDAFKGWGVIIVGKKDLDKTLKCILNNKSELKNHPDPSYRYWGRDSKDSFLVEAFAASDPLRIPHFNNDRYDPTMRVPFFLLYDQKEIHIEILEGCWKLPKKSLDSDGSLNDRHKSNLSGGNHICPIAPEVRQKVEEQLREALIPLYKQMLGIDE